MATGQYISSPSPQCSHYEQPGIIVPPPTSGNLTATGSNPTLSHSPCPECALHTTILHSMAFNMNSMDAACQHLHASSSCSSCYSNYQLQQERYGIGPSHQNQHLHPGMRQYQCGHVKQVPSIDPYAQRNTPTYPSYQFQEWHQPSITHESYLPPTQQIHTTQGYQASTSAPIFPLPSPTFSIPSISPYLPTLESQDKMFDLPSIQDTTRKETMTPNSYSVPVTSVSAQTGVQHKVTPMSSNTSTTQYGGNKINPLSAISSMKISDEGKELKSEPTKERSDSLKRNKMKSSPEKRKSKQDNKLQNSSEFRKRQSEDLCQVCGDRASGYHYNALTCEGCKGFFRRSITNKTTYKQGCKQGGTCEMDTYTRRKCPHCRLKKCREVGMLEECLLTEIQCRSKRRRRRAQQEQVEEIKHDEASQSYSVASPDQSSITSSPSGSDSSRNDEGPISMALTYRERSVIDQVSEAFKQYKINPEIVRRWENYINKESNKTCRLSDIATVHVQVLVEYTKSLPGFISLDPEDQIALLKGSVMEAMLLRNSCGYHHLTREINIPAIIEETGVEATQMKALIEFFSGIGKLGMDENEFALLIAVVVFNSDYPYVKNKSAVEEYQDLYLSTLAKYSISREPHRPFIFARILACLTEIRTLSHFHAEMVTSWKKRGALTPLLCEIWDLD